MKLVRIVLFAFFSVNLFCVKYYIEICVKLKMIAFFIDINIK